MADARNGNINLQMLGKEVVNGVVHLTIRRLNSTLAQPTTNELPVILNAFVGTDYLKKEYQYGFNYTFDFLPTERGGFPYVLNFRLGSR